MVTAQLHQLSVVVASRNAVKINAVAAALQRALPGVTQLAVSDSRSGVADQPFGDAETLRGACNRLLSIQPQQQGSLLVAIEGGVGPVAPLPQGVAELLAWQPRTPINDAPASQAQQLECFAWVVVQAPSGATSHARTASFTLPAAVSQLVLQGLELGDADDAVFGRVKSGHGSGTVGKLTGGLITRQSYYEHAALLALLPLCNPHLYPGFDVSS